MGNPGKIRYIVISKFLKSWFVYISYLTRHIYIKGVVSRNAFEPNFRISRLENRLFKLQISQKDDFQVLIFSKLRVRKLKFFQIYAI